MNQKQLNAKLLYEIKLYLLWNIEVFKENHNILFGELLWYEKNNQALYTYLKSVSVSIQVYFIKNIFHILLISREKLKNFILKNYKL